MTDLPRKDSFTRTVSGLCWEIDDLTFRLETAQAEIESLQAQVAELQTASIKHSREMMGGFITAALKGAFRGCGEPR